MKKLNDQLEKLRELWGKINPSEHPNGNEKRIKVEEQICLSLSIECRRLEEIYRDSVDIRNLLRELNALTGRYSEYVKEAYTLRDWKYGWMGDLKQEMNVIIWKINQKL